MPESRYTLVEAVFGYRCLPVDLTAEVLLDLAQVLGPDFVKDDIYPGDPVEPQMLMDAGDVTRVRRIRWRALGQSHESCRQPRRKDYSRASALVRQWMADESGHDERVWPDLKASLDRNRAGQRRLFPGE